MGGEEGQLHDVAACDVANLVRIGLAQGERRRIVGNVGFEHHGHPTVEQAVVVDLDVVGDLAMQVQVELADRVVLTNDRECVGGVIDRPAKRSLHLDRSEEGVLGLVEGRYLQVTLPGRGTEYATEALGARQGGVEQAFEDPTEDLTEIGLQLVSIGEAILTVEEELSCVARRDRLVERVDADRSGQLDERAERDAVDVDEAVDRPVAEAVEQLAARGSDRRQVGRSGDVLGPRMGL